MELADRRAPAAFTMRELATVLGVRSPMALYRYVSSKDGLSDLMADEVYGLIRVPRGDGWRPALRELGLSGWDAVQRHPWFARLAFSLLLLGPHAVVVYDAALAELEPLGLAAPIRMGFISVVLGQVLSSGLSMLEEQAMRVGTGLRTDADLDRAAAPYLQRITSAGRYPHFGRWAADPARHGATFPGFEQVLDWLLDGLAATVP